MGRIGGPANGIWMGDLGFLGIGLVGEMWIKWRHPGTETGTEVLAKEEFREGC